jgi:hypothetical protein
LSAPRRKQQNRICQRRLNQEKANSAKPKNIPQGTVA